jgi:lipid A 3-O-deacylase
MNHQPIRRSTRPRLFLLATLAGAAALAPAPAAAQGLRPAVAFVQGGAGEDDANVLSAGVRWPWAWRGNAWGGEFSGYTELFGSWWDTRDVAGGSQAIVQVGVVPVVRYRFSQGRSPWFAEIGIGLSVTDQR